MATRNSSSHAHAEDRTQPPSIDSAQQMGAALDAAAQMWRSLEVMQSIQHQSVQRWALRMQQAAEQVRSGATPADLWGIQLSLAGAGIVESRQLLQEIALAASRVQGTWLNRPSQPAASQAMAAPAPDETARAALDAANAAATAVFNSWSSMMGAPSARPAAH